MTYELAKELKNAGFPQRDKNKSCFYWCNYIVTAGHTSEKVEPYVIWGSEGWVDSVLVRRPTLSELISATSQFKRLFVVRPDFWQAEADEPEVFGTGDTPEMAVAMLWLALNKNI